MISAGLRLKAIALLVGPVVASSGFGGPVLAEGGGYGSDWEASATLYGWAISFDGDVKVKGVDADVDVGFDTVFENLNFGAMAEFDIYKGNFGFFFNGVYGQDTADASGLVGAIPISVDAEVDVTFLDFGLKYRTDPIALGDPTASGFQPTVVLEPLAGLRYTNIDVEVDVAAAGLAADLEEQYEFTDPIIGLRGIWRPAERWRIVTHADIGGFGVGSDFSWNVFGVVGYDFSIFGERDASMVLGYRALGQDYSDGPAGAEDAWDVITHGPIAGLTMRF